jgi:hypothetical protein
MNAKRIIFPILTRSYVHYRTDNQAYKGKQLLLSELCVMARAITLGKNQASQGTKRPFA